jgi:hypothetical protein
MTEHNSHAGGSSEGWTFVNDYEGASAAGSEVFVVVAWADESCKEHGWFKKAGWYNIEHGKSRMVLGGNLLRDSNKFHDETTKPGDLVHIAYYAYSNDGKKTWDANNITGSDGENTGKLPISVQPKSNFGPECLDKEEEFSMDFRYLKLAPDTSSKTTTLT